MAKCEAQNQFSERLELEIRSTSIEVEAKTKEAMRAKYEKFELDSQNKYQTMTSRMQKEYQDLADVRKAENEASIEKHKRFETEYVLKVSERSDLALTKIRILAMDPAKWLLTYILYIYLMATSTIELTLFH